DEALDMMKARGTVWNPTLSASWWIGQQMERGRYFPPEIVVKARAAIDGIGSTFRKGLEKGVKIGFGTDAGVYPHGRNAVAVGLMVKLGMKSVDPLKPAASVGAELGGFAGGLVTQDAGRWSGLIAVLGDHAAGIHQSVRFVFVMKEGGIYPNDRGARALEA